MTPAPAPPVLVTGATGRVGRVVVDRLVDAGVPVRALTYRSEAAAAGSPPRSFRQWVADHAAALMDGIGDR